MNIRSAVYNVVSKINDAIYFIFWHEVPNLPYTQERAEGEANSEPTGNNIGEPSLSLLPKG